MIKYRKYDYYSWGEKLSIIYLAIIIVIPLYQFLPPPTDSISQVICKDEMPLTPGNDDNEIDFSRGESGIVSMKVKQFHKCLNPFFSLLHITHPPFFPSQPQI